MRLCRFDLLAFVLRAWAAFFGTRQLLVRRCHTPDLFGIFSDRSIRRELSGCGDVQNALLGPFGWILQDTWVDVCFSMKRAYLVQLIDAFLSFDVLGIIRQEHVTETMASSDSLQTRLMHLLVVPVQ